MVGKVCVIGAGPSGLGILCWFAKLKREGKVIYQMIMMIVRMMQTGSPPDFGKSLPKVTSKSKWVGEPDQDDGDDDGDDDDDIVVTNCDMIMINMMMIIKIHYDDMHSDDPGHCVLRKAILNDDN